MEIKYIDIHSHLNFEQFDTDREIIIQKMHEEGIATITIGTDFISSKSAIDLAEKYEHFFACVGIHPTDVLETDFDERNFQTIAQHEKVVAIGECGLDYFRDQSDELKEKQKAVFKKHIELALAVDKPLMIHARPQKGSMDAYHDVLDIVDSYKQKHTNLQVHFHFFAGDISVAERGLSLGATFSFDGPITFTTDYDEVIRYIPVEHLMTETDSPFAAPVPFRGKRSDPTQIVYINEKLGELKGLTPSEAATIFTKNAIRVFKIPFDKTL